jgi:plasmid stabilization system protein ParE
MTGFRLSDKALAALEAIGEYTEEAWGVVQRDKYLDALDRRFSLLAQSPRQGRLRGDLVPGLRSYQEGAPVIFSMIETRNILILDIPHENMDIPARIEDWT